MPTSKTHMSALGQTASEPRSIRPPRSIEVWKRLLANLCRMSMAIFLQLVLRKHVSVCQECSCQGAAGSEPHMPRFSRFHVLYSDTPKPGRKYRQIVAGPSDDRTFYEVRILEGEVVQMDPDFNAVGTGAEYYSHATGERRTKTLMPSATRGSQAVGYCTVLKPTRLAGLCDSVVAGRGGGPSH